MDSSHNFNQNHINYNKSFSESKEISNTGFSTQINNDSSLKYTRGQYANNPNFSTTNNFNNQNKIDTDFYTNNNFNQQNNSMNNTNNKNYLLNGTTKNNNFLPNNASYATNINNQSNLLSSKEKIKSIEFIKKDILADIIDKASNISEFHSVHKINQKIYENRMIKKELNFFSEKNIKIIENKNSKNFLEKFKNKEKQNNKCFSSSILNSLFYIEESGQIIQLDLNNSTITSFNIFNLFEKKEKLMDCLLIENSRITNLSQTNKAYNDQEIDKKLYNEENSFTKNNFFSNKNDDKKLDDRTPFYIFEVYLIFLFNNLNLIKFNLFDFIQKKNNKDNKYTIYELIEMNKLENFNLKSYLPYCYSDFNGYNSDKNPNIKNNENKKYKNKISKLMKFSEKTNILKLIDNNMILINSTYFSDRLILFNFKTFSIKLNIKINPLNFLQITNPSIFDSLILFLKILVNKNWTLAEKDIFKRIVKDLKDDNNFQKNFENRLKLLAHVLLIDCQSNNVINNYDLAMINKSDNSNIKFNIFNPKNFFEDNINFDLNEKGNSLFQALRNLYIYSNDKHLFDKEKLFNLIEMLQNWGTLLEKLEEYSKYLENGDLKKITYYDENSYLESNNEDNKHDSKKVEINIEKFKNLFYLKFLVKVFRRGIILKKLFKNVDHESNYYVDKEEAKMIIKSFPIGISDEDINEMFNQFPIDENNKLLYNFLFYKEEYFLLDLIAQRKSFYDEKERKYIHNLLIDKNKIIADLKELKKQEKEKINKNPLIYKSTSLNNSSSNNSFGKNINQTKEEEENFYNSYPAIEKINFRMKKYKKAFGYFYGGDADDKELSMILYKKRSSETNLNEILNKNIRLINKEEFNNFSDYRILKNSAYNNYNDNFKINPLVKKLSVNVILNKNGGSEKYLDSVNNQTKKTIKSNKIKDFYINALNIRLFFDDLIYIKNLNIIFSLNSHISKSKIFITKINPEKNHIKKPKIDSQFEVLGFIETFSLEFPKQLYFIPERNLLVCSTFQEFYNKDTLNFFLLDAKEEQEIYFRTKIIKKINTENSLVSTRLAPNEKKKHKGYYNMIFVDIYKDIFDLFQTKRKWKVLNYNVVKNISCEKIKFFKFLPSNKIFIIQTKQEISFINPRLEKQNVSITYDMDPKNETVFDKVCRIVCENPKTLLGDEPCKVIARYRYEKIHNLKILNFSNIEFLQNKNLIDSIYIFCNKKESEMKKNPKENKITYLDNFLFNINSLSMRIRLHVKKLDNPIPDLNKLEIIANKQIDKELKGIREKIEKNIFVFNNLFQMKENEKIAELKELVCRLLTKSFIKYESDPIKQKEIKDKEDLLTKNHIEKIINLMEYELHSFDDYNKFIQTMKILILFFENSIESKFDNKVKLLSLEKLLKAKFEEEEKKNLQSKNISKLSKKNNNNELNNSPKLSSFCQLMKMKNPNFNSKLKKLVSILYYLGINPMSHFRKIKNNKIEFISVNKNSFITFLKTKRIIIEKTILNIKNKIQNKLNPKQLVLKSNKTNMKNSSNTLNNSKNNNYSSSSEKKTLFEILIEKINNNKKLLNNDNNNKDDLDNIHNFDGLYNNNLNNIKSHIFCLNTLLDFLQDDNLLDSLFAIGESYLDNFLISETEKDEITYSRLSEILNYKSNLTCTLKLNQMRNSICIKNRADLHSDNNGFFSLVNGEEHLAEVLAGGSETTNNYTTPFDSGIRKLAKTFYDNSIKIENTFKIFDIDNEEIVDKKQFTIGVSNLKLKLNQLEIDELFKAIDTNNTDCITEDEYYSFMELKLKYTFKEIENQKLTLENNLLSTISFKIDEENVTDNKTFGEFTNINTINSNVIKNETEKVNLTKNSIDLSINNHKDHFNPDKYNTYLNNNNNTNNNKTILDDKNKEENKIKILETRREKKMNQIKNITGWLKKVSNLKPIKNLFMKDIEKYFLEQITFYSFNTTQSNKSNIDFINACYNKFINFLEFIGLQINLSFMFFDCLNTGLVFYDQFCEIMKKSNEKVMKRYNIELNIKKSAAFNLQNILLNSTNNINNNPSKENNSINNSQFFSERNNKSNLNQQPIDEEFVPFERKNYIFTDKEILCIFCEIDLKEKKFYFNTQDYFNFQKKLVSLTLNLSKRGRNFKKSFIQDENEDNKIKLNITKIDKDEHLQTSKNDINKKDFKKEEIIKDEEKKIENPDVDYVITEKVFF